MAIKDLVTQAPSMVGVILMAAAGVYLFASMIVGFVRDRKNPPIGDRSYVPPSEQPAGKPW